MLKSIGWAAALVCSILLVAGATPDAAAAARSPESFARCLRMHLLWQRYETANCPNQSGQRAQAEWALYRCQQADFDRGLPELERLLRRNLIAVP